MCVIEPFAFYARCGHILPIFAVRSRCIGAKQEEIRICEQREPLAKRTPWNLVLREKAGRCDMCEDYHENGPWTLKSLETVVEYDRLLRHTHQLILWLCIHRLWPVHIEDEEDPACPGLYDLAALELATKACWNKWTEHLLKDEDFYYDYIDGMDLSPEIEVFPELPDWVRIFGGEWEDDEYPPELVVEPRTPRLMRRHRRDQQRRLLQTQPRAAGGSSNGNSNGQQQQQQQDGNTNIFDEYFREIGIHQPAASSQSSPPQPSDIPNNNNDDDGYWQQEVPLQSIEEDEDREIEAMVEAGLTRLDEDMDMDVLGD